MPAQTVDLSWQDRASCLGTDPEFFHPRSQKGVTAAKEVCRGCPVRMLCLEYAIHRRERLGIWGGYTEAERRAITRRRIIVNAERAAS